MQNLSDSDLDKIFRDAAEGNKPGFDPDAWEALSGKLDQVVKPAGFWNWKSVSVITGVVLIGSVVLWNTTNQPAPGELQEAGGAISEEAVIPAVKEPETTVLREPKTEVSNSESQPDLTEGQPNLVARESTSSRNKNTARAPLISQQVVANESGAGVVAQTKDVKDVGSVPETELQSTPIVIEQPARPDGQVIVLKEDVPSANLVEQAEESQKNELQEKTDKKSDDNSKGYNRFAIQLSVSPDYSTVNSSSPGELGINYGVGIAYQLNSHWSIASGAIWSKKIYTAQDVEYNGNSMDWVDGDCRMWDIPINVYYQLHPSRSFSFFVGAGLSSYLMSEENYVYCVETAYNTYYYPYQVKGENNEWFKMLNLSIGVQKKLSNQFSIQLEPFLKAPLAGVGEGDVSLASFGAFFNLRYTFSNVE